MSISSPPKSIVSKAAAISIQERNPYKFIEKTLQDAKSKVEKMKGTPQLLDTLTDVILFAYNILEHEEEEVSKVREQIVAWPAEEDEWKCEFADRQNELRIAKEEACRLGFEARLAEDTDPWARGR